MYLFHTYCPFLRVLTVWLWSAWVSFFGVAFFNLFVRRWCMPLHLKPFWLSWWTHPAIVYLHVSVLWELFWRRKASRHSSSSVFSKATITVLCGRLWHQKYGVPLYVFVFTRMDSLAFRVVLILCKLGSTFFVIRGVCLRLLRSTSSASCARADPAAIAELLMYADLLYVAAAHRVRPIFKDDMKTGLWSICFGSASNTNSVDILEHVADQSWLEPQISMVFRGLISLAASARNTIAIPMSVLSLLPRAAKKESFRWRPNVFLECALLTRTWLEEVSLPFGITINGVMFFVEGNVVRVQGLLAGKCNDWKAYSWNGAVWYFNIGGFVWLGHHMLFFRQGVEKLFLGKFYEFKMCFFRLQTHVPFIVIKHLVHSAAAVTNLVDYCRALENKEGHTGTQLMIIMCCVVCMVLSCVLFLSVPSLV